MNNWKLLINLFWLLISLIIILFIVELFDGRFSKETTLEKEKVEGWCGVTAIPSRFSGIDLELGKKLFKENCATCHAKNMVSDMTGPALSGSITRFDKDTLAFMRYLKDPITFMDTTQDERMLALHDAYGKIKKPVYDFLTEDDVKAIVGYIEI